MINHASPASIVLILVLICVTTGISEAATPARLHVSRGTTVVPVRLKQQPADYRIRLGAGQTLGLDLLQAPEGVGLEVIAPGGSEPMFRGSNPHFERVMPTEGDYRIRISPAESGTSRTVRFRLGVHVSGAAYRPIPAWRDALIPGTPFHAAATVPCRVQANPAAKDCLVFVTRWLGDRRATVEVRDGKRNKRRILFVDGSVRSADALDAPGVEREGDRSIVSFGSSERYEIPDALITGG